MRHIQVNATVLSLKVVLEVLLLCQAQVWGKWFSKAQLVSLLLYQWLSLVVNDQNSLRETFKKTQTKS